VIVELEGDTPEYQAYQQQQHRDIKRVENQAVAEGERAEKGASEYDQPCLISVPYRAEAAHHDPPPVLVPGKQGQYPDPQIEAVQDDIKRQN
jgi:hypothetical protein